MKRAGAPSFTTYQVIGWRYLHGGSPLSVSEGPPGRKWFGATPEIYVDSRGPEVEGLIDKIEAAVAAYPFMDFYRTWPGPNSNTFTASITKVINVQFYVRWIYDKRSEEHTSELQSH